MADTVVSANLSALVEGAMLELFEAGIYREDRGRIYRIQHIEKVFLDADGRWVRGWHDPLNPARCGSISGESVEECRRLRLWAMRRAILGE